MMGRRDEHLHYNNRIINPTDLIREGQMLANQAGAIQKAGESNQLQRNQLAQVLNQWRKWGGDYTDHIKTDGYDVLLMDGKYHATKDGQEKVFDTSRELLDYVYGKPVIAQPEGELQTNKGTDWDQFEKDELRTIKEASINENTVIEENPRASGHQDVKEEKISAEIYVNQPWVQEVLGNDSNKEFVYINGSWRIVDRKNDYGQIHLIKESKDHLREERRRAWDSINNASNKIMDILKEKYDQVVFGEGKEFSSFQEVLEYGSAVFDILSGISQSDAFALSSGLDSLWNLEGGPEFWSDLVEQAELIQEKWNTIQLYNDFFKHYNSRINDFPNQNQ